MSDLTDRSDSTQDGDQKSEQTDGVKKGRGRPKKAPKAKKALSLWMKTLQAHGFMKKGSDFKSAPKKGTPAYEAVKAAYDKAKAGGGGGGK